MWSIDPFWVMYLVQGLPYIWDFLGYPFLFQA